MNSTKQNAQTEDSTKAFNCLADFMFYFEEFTSEEVAIGMINIVTCIKIDGLHNLGEKEVNSSALMNLYSSMNAIVKVNGEAFLNSSDVVKTLKKYFGIEYYAIVDDISNDPILSTFGESAKFVPFKGSTVYEFQIPDFKAQIAEETKDATGIKGIYLATKGKNLVVSHTHEGMRHRKEFNYPHDAVMHLIECKLESGAPLSLKPSTPLYNYIWKYDLLHKLKQKGFGLVCGKCAAKAAETTDQPAKNSDCIVMTQASTAFHPQCSYRDAKSIIKINVNRHRKEFKKEIASKDFYDRAIDSLMDDYGMDRFTEKDLIDGSFCTYVNEATNEVTDFGYLINGSDIKKCLTQRAQFNIWDENSIWHEDTTTGHVGRLSEFQSAQKAA